MTASRNDRSQLPFGGEVDWYTIKFADPTPDEKASQLPFGGEVDWYFERVRLEAAREEKSQLPFGGEVDWYPLWAASASPVPSGSLNCLSALMSIGTG